MAGKKPKSILLKTRVDEHCVMIKISPSIVSIKDL